MPGWGRGEVVDWRESLSWWGGGGLPDKVGGGLCWGLASCSSFIRRGWYRVCRKITVVSVFRAAWAAVRTWGLLVVELEREKDSFSLISPIGVVAGATSTPLGDCWRSPESSGGFEAPPHLFLTWRSCCVSELLGCTLLLGRDDVAVQEDLFCQQLVASRRQMDIVFVREGA